MRSHQRQLMYVFIHLWTFIHFLYNCTPSTRIIHLLFKMMLQSNRTKYGFVTSTHDSASWHTVWSADRLIALHPVEQWSRQKFEWIVVHINTDGDICLASETRPYSHVNSSLVWTPFRVKWIAVVRHIIIIITKMSRLHFQMIFPFNELLNARIKMMRLNLVLCHFCFACIAYSFSSVFRAAKITAIYALKH